MIYVMLDSSKKDAVNEYKNTDATPAIMRDDYKYLCKSHKTLLMLRRTSFNTTPGFNIKENEAARMGKAPSEKPTQLELRH